MTPPDEITLTIPRDRALYGVADLVLGGLGIRLNLTIEHLEDLQLALETALDRVRADPVTVTLRVNGRRDRGARRADETTASEPSSPRTEEMRSACAGSSTRSSIVSSSRRRTAATG